jgi:hypothetical protein
MNFEQKTLRVTKGYFTPNVIRANEMAKELEMQKDKGMKTVAEAGCSCTQMLLIFGRWGTDLQTSHLMMVTHHAHLHLMWAWIQAEAIRV